MDVRRLRSTAVPTLVLALAVLGVACGTSGTDAGSAAAGQQPEGPETAEEADMTDETDSTDGQDGSADEEGETGDDDDATSPSSPPPTSSTTTSTTTPTTSITPASPRPEGADADSGGVPRTTIDRHDLLRTTVAPNGPGFRIDLVIRPIGGAAADGLPTDLAAAIAWVDGVHAVEPGQDLIAADGTAAYADVTVQLGAAQDPDRVAARIVEVIGDGYDIGTVKRPSGPIPDRTIGPGDAGT